MRGALVRQRSRCACAALVRPALVSLVVVMAAACDQDHPPGVAPEGNMRPAGGGGTGGGAGGGSGGVSTDVALCELTPRTVLADPTGSGLDFEVASGTDDFVVAFSQARNAVEDVFTRRIDDAGELGDEQRLTNDSALARDPSILGTRSGFLVAFSDDASTTSFDLRVRALDAQGIPVANTFDVAIDPFADERGATFAPGATSDESLLAFSFVDEGLSEARAIAVADTGEPAGTDQLVSDDLDPSAPIDLASIGLAGSPFASFVDGLGALQIVQLTDQGAASDVPTLVRGGADFTGTFDLASGTGGGLAVVGFDRGTAGLSLAARAIDAVGVPDADESPLFEATSVQARSPAAVPFGSGFAVAFRRTDAAGSTVRLAFVDATGRVLGEGDIAVASATGEVRVARAIDGALLVVFEEPLEGGGVSLEAVRVVCPVE